MYFCFGGKPGGRTKTTLTRGTSCNRVEREENWFCEMKLDLSLDATRRPIRMGVRLSDAVLTPYLYATHYAPVLAFEIELAGPGPSGNRPPMHEVHNSNIQVIQERVSSAHFSPLRTLAS